MTKIKILVLGTGQNNFLSFLYGSLKKFDDLFSISLLFYSQLSSKVTEDSWMYDQNNVKKAISFLSFLQAFFYCLFSKHFYQVLVFILFVEGKFKKAIHFILHQIKGKAFFIENYHFKNFDVFHFHYMQYSFLREVFFIPKNKKIVCSFWGSDLLRTADVLNHYFVQKSLRRANVITCQSVEMREIILSKYGRNLLDKIEIAIFPVDQKIYEEIDANEHNQQAITDFKNKYQYSNSKLNILVGHNGSVFNNHIKICKSLQSFKNKDKVHIIINLNYAIKKEEKEKYKSKINEVLEKTNISYTILEDYFSKEELALSRLASDIFIHMPVSDALSGTMTEMLYASNIVVTGSWLPYKTFRGIGLDYTEVTDFEDLSKVLDDLIVNKTYDKSVFKKNKEQIANFFFNKKIIKKWAEILNEI